jgi:capsule polysaccharide export protein KpsE/RkpR
MANLRYMATASLTNKPKKKERRGWKWTEKSMIFQIIMVFLAIFIVYFGGHAAALYAYTSAFIGITEDYVDVQVQA